MSKTFARILYLTVLSHYLEAVAEAEKLLEGTIATLRGYYPMGSDPDRDCWVGYKRSPEDIAEEKRFMELIRAAMEKNEPKRVRKSLASKRLRLPVARADRKECQEIGPSAEKETSNLAHGF